MKDIKETTKEEYDKMNVNEFYSYDNFRDGFEEEEPTCVFHPLEIEWLTTHEFNTSNLKQLDKF